MTRRTSAKVRREIREVVPQVTPSSSGFGKVIGFLEPKQVEYVVFEFEGKIVKFPVSEGQCINPKKVWKRYLCSQRAKHE